MPIAADVERGRARLDQVADQVNLRFAAPEMFYLRNLKRNHARGA